MAKIKYVLTHGGVFTLVLAVAVSIVTVTVFGWVKQLSSASDGIEVLMVNTTLTYGATSLLEDEITSVTDIVAGVAVLETSEAEEYIKTVNNYTLKDYIADLCTGKNTEILIVPASLLNTALSVKNIVPLDIPVSKEHPECFIDDIAYAMPIGDFPVTKSGVYLDCIGSEEIYALLLNGDHTADARIYLENLINENSQNNGQN